MDNEKQSQFGQSEEVLYFEDLFFITEETIRSNDEMVRQSFQDLYKYVNYN